MIYPWINFQINAKMAGEKYFATKSGMNVILKSVSYSQL
jgi:hypothetical protein